MHGTVDAFGGDVTRITAYGIDAGATALSLIARLSAFNNTDSCVLHARSSARRSTVAVRGVRLLALDATVVERLVNVRGTRAQICSRRSYCKAARRSRRARSTARRRARSAWLASRVQCAAPYTDAPRGECLRRRSWQSIIATEVSIWDVFSSTACTLASV